MVREWSRASVRLSTACFTTQVDVDEAPICEQSQETELVCCAHVLSHYVQATIEIDFLSDGIDSPFRCRKPSTKSETSLVPWRSVSVTGLFFNFQFLRTVRSDSEPKLLPSSHVRALCALSLVVFLCVSLHSRTLQNTDHSHGLTCVLRRRLDQTVFGFACVQNMCRALV